ncbi:MAG: tetratricopeptide repeat protein [bacterium]|nr:tetratricopeptide repeat protein [bacterium]
MDDKDLERPERVLEAQKRALEVKERVKGLGHHSLATSCYNISAIYVQLEDYDQAREYARKAVSILEAKFPANHPNVIVMKQYLQSIPENA